jgi:hypothetical protein
MEELFLGLAIIMTFSSLLFIHRLNLRLAHYPEEPAHQAWSMTNKINTFGKVLALAGGVATLPVVIMLLFAPDTIAMEWIIYIAASGMVALIVAVPIMLLTLIWRTSLSRLSMATITNNLFKAAQRMLQRHWRMISFSFIAVALFIILLPALKYVAYLFGWLLLGKLGLLDEENYDDEDEGIGDFYNYNTGKWDHGYSFGGIYDHDD